MSTAASPEASPLSPSTVSGGTTTANQGNRGGFKSTRLIAALAFLAIISLLCVGVAFLDRKMVLLFATDSTPASTLTLRRRVPPPGELTAEQQQVIGFKVPDDNEEKDRERGPMRRSANPLDSRSDGSSSKSGSSSSDNSGSSSSGSGAHDTSRNGGSELSHPSPFRIVQDDISVRVDNNRWEVTHIARNDSLRVGLKEVEGLRNEEVVVFITSTFKKHGIYLRDRIIPSSRTWMREVSGGGRVGG